MKERFILLGLLALLLLTHVAESFRRLCTGAPSI
jgi:hypothetical protein